ncbi:MAG: helix-turn-helix domain-containing protein [Micavibrio sp.]
MNDDIMTIREVAQFLRLTEKTAYRYALEEKIPGFKVGGVWRFRRDEIEKLTKVQSTQRIKKAS